MSTTEAILEKLKTLPPAKREEVLNYIISISEPSLPPKQDKPYPWMETALKANLQGPPDWSEHLDDYLYGVRKNAP
jgi:hypothetical protein